MNIQDDKSTKKSNPKNVWIIKPGENSNRGNGISIFDNLEDVKYYIFIRIQIRAKVTKT